MMHKGVIKNFNFDRGYGFLIPDDGSPEFFAHITAFAPGTEPRPGQRVEFSVGRDPSDGRRSRAAVVRLA